MSLCSFVRTGAAVLTTDKRTLLLSTDTRSYLQERTGFIEAELNTVCISVGPGFKSLPLNWLPSVRFFMVNTCHSHQLLCSGTIIFVNNQLDSQFFFMYVYFNSLHVSGSHVPIIRRINCINTTSGICHSVQMTVWCAGLDKTQSHPNMHTTRSPTYSDIYQMSYWYK
jgi:hypothetical protein